MAYNEVENVMNDKTMRAIVVHEPGGPEILKSEVRPVPNVKEGWSRVKVIGFGVNHSEIFTRRGLSPSVSFPRVLGIECTGVIDETTDRVRLPVGQKIVSIMGEMGRAFDGGYEEYVLLPNEQIYPIETDLPWDTLIALPETGYTAYGSLKNMKISADDTILIRGATSGVGITAAAFLKAKYPNLYLSGTSRNSQKETQLRDAGFDELIIDREGLLETEKKFDKILDLIGPATMKDTFAHVKEGGIVCSTGQLGGQWTLDFDPISELPPNGYLTSFHSANVDQKRLQEMFDFVERYQPDIHPEKIFSLENTEEAHRYLESRESFGKVIVRVVDTD